jgi:signal transduction histidine kinase
VWTTWPHWRISARSADRLLAAVLLIWALFDVPWWWRPPGHSGSTLAILGVLALAAAQSVPFLWRRTQPVAVLAVTGAALAVKYATHLNVWSASAAVLAAAYGLGAYGGRTARQAARVLAFAAGAAALIALPVTAGNHSAAVACALLAAAFVLGDAASAHRDLATAAARHAHDLERASLAREIHDVVANRLSGIAVQAGAARLASGDDPQAARAAITAIEQEARDGLGELNTLVRALHQSELGEPGLPELGDLPRLLQRARESGLRPELRIDGQPRPLAAAAELAVYRVVQESLTNAIRYAPGAAVKIQLAYRADGVLIQVADNGPGAPAAVTAGQGGGTGLAGLSERARLLGGRLQAGSDPAGGFVVDAFLPDTP